MQKSVYVTTEDKIQQETVSGLKAYRKRVTNIRKIEQIMWRMADVFQRFDSAIP